MTTHDTYTIPVSHEAYTVPMAGDTRFSWEYDAGRARLLALYQKGKDKQWDAQSRIDWDHELDYDNPLAIPQELNELQGSKTWERVSRDPKELTRLTRHQAAWQMSQFVHGEQGAMICSARIVESVPDIDAKFYAATQTMDEARHVEVYSKLLQDKIKMAYPISDPLRDLLDETLRDSRWDMPYLGMQVLIEGLALAAFGLMRDQTTDPLIKSITAYVMQDEARHVAFGRLSLKDAYRELSTKEREEREEFVVAACYLMRDRFRKPEVWERLGYDMDDCLDAVDHSEVSVMFRNLLFTRIVPCIKDIGLWGDKVQKAYADMGVLDYAGANLDGLMASDEATAEELDAEKRAAEARTAEVHEAIAVGASA
ncbi:MAG TPA: ferritin-like domain-containing protein [Mycobacteriales bacterium]